MENDSPCKTVRRGTVKVKMYDGIVMTLSNIRHVLDLMKNLISLGTLESNGLKYSA